MVSLIPPLHVARFDACAFKDYRESTVRRDLACPNPWTERRTVADWSCLLDIDHSPRTRGPEHQV